jgi:NAD(P)-dependent dehydrogenase (short-subunit alcohol dehydrogenase family)
MELQRSGSHTGRAAIVTGGSGGIGASIIAHISAQGVDVINLDRQQPPNGCPARFVHVDLCNEAETKEVLAEITAKQTIGWLVNNAGIALPASLEQTRMSDFERVISVNVRSAILCAQAVLPGMKTSSHGRIVNITSRAALGKELRTAYSAAKAAIVGLTRTWALELAAHGITVNAVGPGPIETPLFRSANPPDSPRTKAILDGIPLKRLGQPEDIASAVSFFLSERASFITGQTLFVCGGLSVGPAGSLEDS